MWQGVLSAVSDKNPLVFIFLAKVSKTFETFLRKRFKKYQQFGWDEDKTEPNTIEYCDTCRLPLHTKWDAKLIHWCKFECGGPVCYLHIVACEREGCASRKYVRKYACYICGNYSIGCYPFGQSCEQCEQPICSEHVADVGYQGVCPLWICVHCYKIEETPKEPERPFYMINVSNLL